MKSLKNKFMYFMQGRYGQDDLYKACLVLYLFLLVVNIFFSSFFLHVLINLLVVIVFFRFFSKNISARQRENAKYLLIKHKIKSSLDMTKKRLSDKERVWRKCPSCRATIRFPRKKGRHTAVCPRCKKEFTVKVI